MKKILIVAPHLDDETLGCGGTILKYSKKYSIDLLLITRIESDNLYKKRLKIIETINKIYKFKNILQLKFITATLSQNNIPELIDKLREVNLKNNYSIIFTPYIYDIHTDHQIVSHSVLSAFKSFRSKNKNKLYFYETLSETNFSIHQFKPNKYVDITNYISKKIHIAKKFKSEFSNHPFPRSEKSIKSLSILRGSESMCEYAEAFYLVNDNVQDL